MKLWRQGYKVVAGLDEVGRGCFAGSVVAGCAVFNKTICSLQGASLKGRDTVLINDSKKLKPRQREIAAVWIKKNALTWGIGEASVSEINRLGMGKATKIAFRRAISVANQRLRYKDTKILRKVNKVGKTPSIIVSKYPSIEFLLIDAFYIPYVNGLRKKNQKAIIDGDEKSISIAAASIIAKVYRDKKMLSLSKVAKYKKYGWGRNKGYGTREHQKAIRDHGITRHHRRAFVQTWLGKVETGKQLAGRSEIR
ncbi:ribonuclease HII [Candidatus Woesebacteria bacterium]|nr:ribonuclease HII [Candidatus Woesebacteria bacterium]